jgi:hypothetical protein
VKQDISSELLTWLLIVACVSLFDFCDSKHIITSN